jgi:hypothetical protein
VPALRLHLPPNLPAAAARNAVALRIELNPETAPEPEILPVLAFLQALCGTARPPAFVQLTRPQMRGLVGAAGGQPVFFEGGRPVKWDRDALLEEPAQAPGAAAPPAPLPRKAAPLEPLVVDGSEHYLAVTLPSREDRRYLAALELLKTAGFVLEPSNRKWWLRDRHKTLSFLASQGTRLRGELGAQFTPNFVSRTAHLVPAEINCEAMPSGDGWDVSVGLRAGSATEAEVREAVATGRAYVESGGKVILIDPESVRRLAQAQRALADGGADTVSARGDAGGIVPRVPPARGVERADGRHARSLAPRSGPRSG